MLICREFFIFSSESVVREDLKEMIRTELRFSNVESGRLQGSTSPLQPKHHSITNSLLRLYKDHNRQPSRLGPLDPPQVMSE
jgi:hypothetical protein